MCKTCVNPVQTLLKGCESSSTASYGKLENRTAGVDGSRLISILSNIHSQAYPQSKSSLLPLFEQLLYPVSTAPITMNKRLRKV